MNVESIRNMSSWKDFPFLNIKIFEEREIKTLYFNRGSSLGNKETENVYSGVRC